MHVPFHLLVRPLRTRLLAGAAIAAVGLTAAAQTDRDESLTVDAPRPVAEAVRELMKRYGVVITYEDPRYAYAGDVTDRSSDRTQRNLVPLGGHFDFRYRVSPQTGGPADWSALLDSLIAQYAAGGTGARFRVERDGNAYHVVPRQVRDSAGRWVDTTSILDAHITIPAQELTKAGIIAAICAAVSESMNIHLLDNSRVGLGVGPVDGPPRERFAVANERARDVLMRELQGYRPGVAWLIYQDPGTNDYYLNLTYEAVREPPPAAPSK